MLIRIRSRWIRQFVCGFAALLFIRATGSADDDPKSGAEPSVSARRLEQMKGRAVRATVRIVSEGPQVKTTETLPEVQFDQQPIFRYSDPPRDFRDATLWMWTANGRPVALQKVEDWRPSERGPMWITCFASLHTGLIESSWKKGPTWTSTKPGLPFQLVDFERPEASDSGRLRQFKKLSERFTVALERDQSGTPDTQEMRRLPRHLHRYQVADQRIADAVIFGWTANGTNPDVVVVIEQRSIGDKHEWHYAMSGITSDKVALSLDGKIVQSQDYTKGGGGPTLRFFFERNMDPID